jgi:hypothetical protein
MTPDWSRSPEGVPYADFGNPQSLNLYAYAGNNPVSRRDTDGHCDKTSSFIDSNGAMHVVAEPCNDGARFYQLFGPAIAVGHHFVDQALIAAKGAWESGAGRFFRRWTTGRLQFPGLHTGYSAEHRLNSAQIKEIIEGVEQQTGRSMSQWNSEDIEKAVEEVRSAGGDVKAFTDGIAANNPGTRTLADDIKPLMDAVKAGAQAIEDFAAKQGPNIEEGIKDLEETCVEGGCVPP